MKNISKIVLIAILVYLLFSFAKWDINAGNWSEEARLYCVYVMSIACWLFALIIYKPI